MEDRGLKIETAPEPEKSGDMFIIAYMGAAAKINDCLDPHSSILLRDI
jgi:hypothetical protein